METLSLTKLKKIVGKTIKWNAPAYHANSGFFGKGLYGGITKITEIDSSLRRPILQEQKVDEKSDSIIFAFVDADSILNYSDSDRLVSFEIIEKVMKVLLIKSIIPSNNRINNAYFTGTRDQIYEKLEWLKNREIVSIEEIEYVFHKQDYIDNIDLLIKENDTSEKPDAFADERAWNEMYQKTTGNPLPKGGILR